LAQEKFNLQFQAFDKKLKPLPNSNYFVLGAGGVMQVEKTDAEGKTRQWITKAPDFYSVHIVANDDAVEAEEGGSA
jgi:hypothetical protein